MAFQQPAGDSLRRVLDSVFAAKAYQWLERPDPFATIRRWWEALKAWFWLLSDTNPTLYWVLTAAMTVLLVAILVHIGWIFFSTVRGRLNEAPASGASRERRTEGWYRREADRLAAEGRYVEAMQADFLALVIVLDRANLLRFHPSKTPVEYLEEVRLAPERRQEFRELVRALYGFAFARWPCDEARFADWRRQAAVERYAPAA